MAFIRERIVEGKRGMARYYQVLETYQENGRKKQRVVCNLGKHPSVGKAWSRIREHGYGLSPQKTTKKKQVYREIW